MLSQRFKYTKKTDVLVSPSQLHERDIVLEKILRQYQAVNRYCVICGGSKFVKISEKDRYGLPVSTVLCHDCGLLQTNPVLREEDYHDFYSNHYRNLYTGTQTSMPHFFDEQRIRGTTFFNDLSGRGFLKNPKKVLEVGCGAGGILSVFAQHGHQVTGIDLDKSYLAYGRSRGLNLIFGTSNNLTVSDKFDVIIYSHVVEHLFDPRKELRRARELLSPDGILLIEVPGVYKIVRSYSGDLLRYLQNAHLYHFTLQSLRNLVETEGFTMLAGSEKVYALFKVSEPHRNFVNEFEKVETFLKSLERIDSRVFSFVLKNIADLRIRLRSLF